MFTTLVQLTNNFYKQIVLIFVALFFSSCVYFNTFYNAEDSFNKAIEIIDTNSSKNFNQDQNLSNIEKKLLYESISSSAIVIDKYSDSKYVDDAIYYTARSYFVLNENYKSEIYFNKLILNYPKSDYYLESLLWLEYNHLKMGLIDSSFKRAIEIEEFFNNKEKIRNNLYYLLYNLKGDILISLKNYDEAFIQFEKSLSFLKTKIKKIAMYSKLVIISKQENELERAIDYLNKIQLISTNKDIKIETFKKWIEINKELNKYDNIIAEIEKNILKSDFQSTNLMDDLSLELASSYLKIKNYTYSKNLFNKIIEDTNQKKIKAQAYYWLGYISLMHEFETGLAEEYFELVTETMRSSKFSKKSKLFLSEIDEYNKVLNEYIFLEQDNSLTKDTNVAKQFPPNNQSFNEESSKDSLLFIIAEKLYFDFNQIDLSLKKHKDLVKLFPLSSYTSRSSNIIKKLGEENNSFFTVINIDSLATLRDNAWNKINNSNKVKGSLEAVEKFKDIANRYEDFYSYYSIGIIYEDYLFFPDSAIIYYSKSLQTCNNAKLRSKLINKMLLLKESFNTNILVNNQKLNYLKAINFIKSDFNLDSANLYLERNLNNNQKHKKSSALNDFIIDFQKKNLDINNNKNIDSTAFYLANFCFFVFENKNLSIDLIDKINDSSKYYEMSRYLLDVINDQETSIPDSVGSIFEKYNTLKINFIPQNNIEDSLLYYININKKLIKLFPEQMIDTLEIDEKELNFNFKNDLNLNFERKNNIMQDIKY